MTSERQRDEGSDGGETIRTSPSATANPDTPATSPAFSAKLPHPPIHAHSSSHIHPASLPGAGVSVFPSTPMVIRLLLSHRSGGCIIGRGGSTIADLRRKVGSATNIDMGDLVATERGRWRIATVRGPLQGVQMAVGTMIDLLVAQRARSKPHPPIATTPTGDSDATPVTIALHFVVPCSQIGAILGSGGSTIHQLRAESQATIRVSHRLGSSDEKRLMVAGGRSQVMKAVNVIINQLYQARAAGAATSGVPFILRPPSPEMEFNISLQPPPTATPVSEDDDHEDSLPMVDQQHPPYYYAMPIPPHQPVSDPLVARICAEMQDIVSQLQHIGLQAAQHAAYGAYNHPMLHSQGVVAQQLQHRYVILQTELQLALQQEQRHPHHDNASVLGSTNTSPVVSPVPSPSSGFGGCLAPPPRPPLLSAAPYAVAPLPVPPHPPFERCDLPSSLPDLVYGRRLPCGDGRRVCQELFVRSALMGALIGARGEGIRNLRKISNARIYLDHHQQQNRSGEPGGINESAKDERNASDEVMHTAAAHRLVLVSGIERQVASAVRMIEDSIQRKQRTMAQRCQVEKRKRRQSDTEKTERSKEPSTNDCNLIEGKRCDENKQESSTSASTSMTATSHHS